MLSPTGPGVPGTEPIELEEETVDTKKSGDNSGERFSNTAIGREYDAFQESVPWHEEFQQQIGTDLQQRLEINFPGAESHTVIEGGCGTGITTETVLNADPKVTIIAVDNSHDTISKAKEILGDEPRVKFVEGDIVRTLESMDPESVEGFVSAYMLHNFNREFRREVLARVAKALKKGGVFVNGDKYARDNEAEHVQDLANQLASFVVYKDRPQMLVEWTKHYIEDDAPDVRMTESEARQMMEELGFTDIEFTYRKGMEAILRAAKS